MQFSMRALAASAILFTCAPMVALADSSIIVADDSSSGTYQKMLGDIISVCSTDQFRITEAHGVSGGAPGNLDALINNRAQAAFLHSDVFTANAQADPSYRQYKTLIALYPEPIHVLVLKDSKSKKAGFNVMGAKQEFSMLSDLRGFKVGASGGGVYTARILEGQGESGFTVVRFDKGDNVIDALSEGSIDAAIFVGAAPLPNIAKLDSSQFKLIPIDDKIASKVKGVYREANINYPGLTDGAIHTMAPVATLLTRQYQTGEKIAAQRSLRSCFQKNLARLQDNASPNWRQVQPGDHGVIDWYEIPGSK